MTCKKCKSYDVNVQMMSDTSNTGTHSQSKAKRAALAVATGGLSTIFSARNKTKTKMVKMAICQTCGYNWKV